MSEQEQGRWQPIMIILRTGGRLECKCGALAVVVIGEITNEYNQLDQVDHWCQSCYQKEQATLVE